MNGFVTDPFGFIGKNSFLVGTTPQENHLGLHPIFLEELRKVARSNQTNVACLVCPGCGCSPSKKDANVYNHITGGACGSANFVLLRLQLIIMRRLIPHFVERPLDQQTAIRVSRLWFNLTVVIGREHHIEHDRYRTNSMQGFDFGLSIAFNWAQKIKKNGFSCPVPAGKMPRTIQKPTTPNSSSNVAPKAPPINGTLAEDLGTTKTNSKTNV
jgi:hypothetical protein